MCSYLTTVLSKVERASLWKVMMTLVGGRSELHILLRHLQTAFANSIKTGLEYQGNKISGGEIGCDKSGLRQQT